MPTLKLLCACLILKCFTGCDPGRTLIIKAANKPNISVTIFGNKNILPNNRLSDEKIIIHVPIADEKIKFDTAFDFGIGAWGEEKELPFFVSNIDSIKIVNTTNIIFLRSKLELTNYLLSRRTGYLGSILTIEAK